MNKKEREDIVNDAPEGIEDADAEKAFADSILRGSHPESTHEPVSSVVNANVLNTYNAVSVDNRNKGGGKGNSREVRLDNEGFYRRTANAVKNTCRTIFKREDK